MRIIVTGTPATGKSSVSQEIGALLQAEVVHVNELIRRERLYSRIEKGEMVADFEKLGRVLKGWLKMENVILESHLLSDLKLPADVVIVLRCTPEILEKRLKGRGYSKGKIQENIMAEMLDYSLVNALENYGKMKVVQIDASKRITARKVLKEMNAFRKKGKMKTIRWLRKATPRELLKICRNA